MAYPDEAIVKVHPEEGTGEAGSNLHDLSHHFLNNGLRIRACPRIKPNLQSLPIGRLQDKNLEEDQTADNLCRGCHNFQQRSLGTEMEMSCLMCLCGECFPQRLPLCIYTHKTSILGIIVILLPCGLGCHSSLVVNGQGWASYREWFRYYQFMIVHNMFCQIITRVWLGSFGCELWWVNPTEIVH